MTNKTFEEVIKRTKRCTMMVTMGFEISIAQFKEIESACEVNIKRFSHHVSNKQVLMWKDYIKLWAMRIKASDWEEYKKIRAKKYMSKQIKNKG